MRALVADLVGWARALMLEGAPLVHTLPGRVGWELRLVVQGGLRILDKIERHGHDAVDHGKQFALCAAIAGLGGGASFAGKGNRVQLDIPLLLLQHC